jgi:hypothetical protein
MDSLDMHGLTPPPPEMPASELHTPCILHTAAIGSGLPVSEGALVSVGAIVSLHETLTEAGLVHGPLGLVTHAHTHCTCRLGCHDFACPCGSTTTRHAVLTTTMRVLAGITIGAHASVIPPARERQ